MKNYLTGKNHLAESIDGKLSRNMLPSRRIEVSLGVIQLCLIDLGVLCNLSILQRAAKQL